MAFLLWEFPITMIAENCMKMKEFGPRGGVPAPPLDQPMMYIYWSFFPQIVFHLFTCFKAN